METLIKLQINTKSIIEKAKINFKKTPKERITRGYIKTRLEALENQWQKFENTHTKIIELATEEEMKGTYFTADVYERTEEIYVNYKSDLMDSKLKYEENNDCEQTLTRGNKSKNIKLPKINIPNFSGDFAEWTSFRDLFTSLVHKNVELDDVEKLHYLKGLLRGEAEQLLRQSSVTEANYQLCWTKLEQRYNNKRRLANNILQRMFNQKRINVESAVSLKQLLDTTIDCTGALSNLGIDVTTWDIIIIHIMASKLDPETRKQWELKLSEDSSNELPTLKQFQLFIESRFTAFENIEVPRKITVQSHGIQSSNQRVLLATQRSNVTNQMRCEFCSENHKLCFCKGFMQLAIDKKRQFVTRNKICYNCLGGNHMVGQCKKNTSCRLCKKRHHTLLHSDSTSVNQVEQGKTGISSDDPNASNVSMPVVSCLSTKISQPRLVLLATALVKAQTAAHDFQIVRALLDQGSQASFITEAAVQFLRLKKSPIRGVVSGIGNGKSSVANYMVKLVLQSLTESGFEIEVKAYVLKNITSYLPDRQLEPIRWPDLEHLVLADPHFSKPNKIDVLLGADVYSEILRDGVKKAPTGTLVAQSTSLGWILSGMVEMEPKVSQVNKIMAMHAHIEETDILKRFWEIEDQLPNSERIFTEEEQRCEELFASTTRRTADGRYIVRLPFKNQNPSCVGGKTREIALKRFFLLERKLSRDPDLKERYTNVIKEYLQLDHMKKVDINDSKINETVYLPHHAVIRDDKSTTRVRVVFDASCKNENGVSLNDTLMIGPTLQSDLRHIVLRWRMHYVAIIADIVKMYRQVRVADQDIPYQRIVWRDSPDEDIQDFSLTTVTFGTASAPYLAVKALHQIALDEGGQYPTAAVRVPNSYYMDDMMISCSTVEEGKILCHEMKNLLKKAGFELQKWNSNHEDIVKEMECYNGGVQDTSTEKGKESREEIEIFESTKILGLTWCRHTDEFRYTVQLPAAYVKWSKRNIISDISRLFDPLGWLAPSIILAKILIQKLWLAGVNWDDELSDSVKTEWETYRATLPDLSKVRVPRWLGITDDISCVELHGFSDASRSAYAAVVYTRTVHSENDIRVSLLVAKTKVAPIKQISIPRLELCGAVLLARLLADVAKAMGIPKGNIHAWTDSTVVLAWLNSHPSRWKTFVANRVSEILTTLDSEQFAHVSSKANPADCASRGIQPSLLSENKLWFEGPQFLYNPKVLYSRPVTEKIVLEEAVKCHTGTVRDESIWIKFSSLWRLVRVIAYCKRFINLRNRHFRPKYLQATELEECLKTCIRYFQQNAFGNEYSQIKNKTFHKLKGSKIRSLNPFLDDDDILRVGGRLREAPLSDQLKHPIILPHDAHLTKLLIADAHEQTLHGGPQLMINYLRSAYWIIGVKSLVKQHVRKCVICAKYNAKINTQLMGSLPSVRCTPTRPFLHSGLDYAGPINLRTTKGRGYKSYKGYICVFVCMATRGVHLEVVSDLSTQGFLAAFRRFVARRGHCAQIWSDNGTNFVGAAKELKALQQNIAEYLEGKGTVWHFIPPHAPNFGGLWEAAVKSTKYHLKRVIGDSTLTFEEMSTFLSQIEACLNSRPITVVKGEGLDEPLPLTPGHFLVGEPLVTVPEPNYEVSYISPLNRWQLIQRMLQNFWRRWSAEYLTTLVHRYKWSFQNPEPDIGDVVLVKESDLPPARWLLGRIVQKHPGSDNVTRVVTLKVRGSLLKRPTSKLIILPVNE